MLKALARIASIPLILLSGCVVHKGGEIPPPPPAAPAPVPPQAMPQLPPAPPPAPPPPRRQSRITVPENTRDPVLVEQGVREWLAERPEYPHFQKVAILHRMKQESGFNPCARNGPMHHLLQWRDSRLVHLYRATRSRPGSCPSWLAQMRFMDQEIKSDHRNARFFFAENEPKAYRLFTTVYLGGVMGRP
jgi:hypothetical protein